METQFIWFESVCENDVRKTVTAERQWRHLHQRDDVEPFARGRKAMETHRMADR